MLEQTPEADRIGPLTIVVCIKQVPLLSALRFDPESRRLVREGVPLEINELDIYALSEAIRLCNIYGGEVIAVTMGPPPAREALATALAMGVHRTIHLNDRAFGGADTAATARTLALAIRHIFAQHPFDLIFCGRHSIDAETAQVGPEIAEMLDLPQISAVQKIDVRRRDDQREIIATRETDDGSETLIAPLPALVTAAEGLNEGIWPDEHDIREAGEQAGERIQVLSAADLHVDLDLLGQKGSPTWVADIEADTRARAGRIIAESDPARAVELLLDELQARGLLDQQDAPSPAAAHATSAAPRRQGAPLAGRAVWVVAERMPELAARAEAIGRITLDRLSKGNEPAKLLIGGAGVSEGIRRITLELLGKGNELAASLQGELAALLIGGPGVGKHAEKLAAYGAERVYVIEDAALEGYTTEGYTAAVAQAIERYRPAVVLMGSTADGRDLAPRVAARLKLGLTGDCIDLAIDEQQRLVQYKPAFGGSIVSAILSTTTPAMATLRPGMLHAAVPDFSRTAQIEPVSIEGVAGQIRTQIVGREYRDTGVAALEAAQTVIGVGMGMGEPENYQPLYRLAGLLHAAIGATRNVADHGWLPKQKQIGLTGRAVSPQLYLALGIRGAAEHIAGIRKAGFVVSINKNKRAAIFRHSDIGVVGDVHVLLPLLVEQLERQIQE
jgi:electron transfer flavoprotein alpha subunit